MRLSRKLRPLGCVLGLLAARPAPASEVTRFELLHFRPVPMAEPGIPAPASIPALLTAPMSWQAGDAAVVLLTDPPEGSPRKRRVADAMLDAQAAVLELDLSTPRGFSADSAFDAREPAPEELVAELLGALVALRRHSGAGLVVAIGLGTVGMPAVLLAAEALRRDPALAGGEGFAAHVALGEGPPVFLPGSRPAPAEEAWPHRAALFCDALASGLAGPPAPPPVHRMAETAGLRGACQAGLDRPR